MNEWSPQTPLGYAVYAAGFSYDSDQQIIYSRMDAMQRYLGYAYAYDLAALGMSANLQCEPIFFDYNGKSWMVELWKGQYGLETGCEIGVYNRPISGAPDCYELLDRTVGQRPVDPKPEHSRFFQSADDADLLTMSSVLRRNGDELLRRESQPHWWLTGFKWGVYSDPDDLEMDVEIACPDASMQEALTGALTAMGYQFTLNGLIVSFTFGSPLAPQPPKDAAIVSAVDAANSAIVATYTAQNFPSNDPNVVSGEATPDIAAGALRYIPTSLLSKMFDVLGSQSISPDEAATVFTSLGVDANTVLNFLAGAAVPLSTWMATAYAVLHDTFAMNFHTIVEIVNGTDEGPPGPVLRLIDAHVDQGAWLVRPPDIVNPGDIVRFELKDNFGPHGSKGRATYAYQDASGDKQITFEFSDPTGWHDNTASVNPTIYVVYAKSGDDPNWSAHVPKGGHPLFVAYTYGDAQPR